MNETNISAADLARLFAMVKEHQSVVLSHRSACWDNSDDRRDSTMRRMRDIERQIANAAPSLLAEVGRLHEVEEAARELLDYMGKWEDDTIPGLHWQHREDALRAALSPSPEVGT